MGQDIPVRIIIIHLSKKRITKIFCYTSSIFVTKVFLMCGQAMIMYSYYNDSILPIVIKIHWLRERCIAGKHLALSIFQNHNTVLRITSLPASEVTMRMVTAAA